MKQSFVAEQRAPQTALGGLSRGKFLSTTNGNALARRIKQRLAKPSDVSFAIIRHRSAN